MFGSPRLLWQNAKTSVTTVSPVELLYDVKFATIFGKNQNRKVTLQKVVLHDN